MIRQNTRIFSVLSNPVRLRCLYLLARNAEICVCEFVEALEISQPSASKALAALKAAGLVTDRRDANWTYYCLNPALSAWQQTIIEATVEELSASKSCRIDEERFLRQASATGKTTCL
ncbi:MAG: metalloregulator ArsR/SmtB family transcription factor [Gammaproteobacteria bacterium]|jgi:ArsR family transcriptional regulator